MNINHYSKFSIKIFKKLQFYLPTTWTCVALHIAKMKPIPRKSWKKSDHIYTLSFSLQTMACFSLAKFLLFIYNILSCWPIFLQLHKVLSRCVSWWQDTTSTMLMMIIHRQVGVFSSVLITSQCDGEEKEEKTKYSKSLFVFGV